MLSRLNAALPDVALAPKTDAPIDHLCLRPAHEARVFPAKLTLDSVKGVIGDRWLTTAWLTLPDGRPDPRIQVSILPLRVLNAVWQDRETTPHPGDQIIADLDTSSENLPIGTLIRAGSAVLRVSDVPNYGCAKWRDRYGADALRWTASHPEMRLRGVLCAIQTSGTVTLGDRLQVLR